MEKQGVFQFDIEGEYLTSLAREWFYVEGKGYDKCIELLNGCMSGTDETKTRSEGMRKIFCLDVQR